MRIRDILSQIPLFSLNSVGSGPILSNPGSLGRPRLSRANPLGFRPEGLRLTTFTWKHCNFGQHVQTSRDITKSTSHFIDTSHNSDVIISIIGYHILKQMHKLWHAMREKGTYCETLWMSVHITSGRGSKRSYTAKSCIKSEYKVRERKRKRIWKNWTTAHGVKWI